MKMSMIFSNATKANNPLATGGLTIRGQTSESVGPTMLIMKAPAKVQDSETNTPPQNQNISQNFAKTLMGRLEKEQLKADSGNRKSLEETQAFMDSLTGALDEIKDKFGQETANHIMAEILTNTERGMSGDRIAHSFIGALKVIAITAAETLRSDTATDSEVEDALNTKKLADLLNFLNNGTAESDDSDLQGLSGALNSYFGNPAFPLAEEEQKIFDTDFSWKTVKEISEKNAPAAFAFDLSLSVKELGQLHVDKLVKFLRDELGLEEAASYIENLGADDDIFTAVNHVKNLMWENTTVTGGFLGYEWREGPGAEQVHKLTEFLQYNMLDAVNSAFRNDPELSDRLKDFASMFYNGKVEDVPSGIGLTTWPGGLLGGQNSSSIYVADIGDTTVADRHEQFLFQAGDFWRGMAQSTGEENRQKYEGFAQNCDKSYEEYLLGKNKTEPGALVDQQA
jgi:hypothetical protein